MGKYLLILLIAISSFSLSQTLDSTGKRNIKIRNIDLFRYSEPDSLNISTSTEYDSTYMHALTGSLAGVIDSVNSRDSLSRHDSLSMKDSLSRKDSLRVKAKALNPLMQQSLTQSGQYSNYITKEQMRLNDNRFTAELLNWLPLTFIRDLGKPGQPSEVTVYGAGFNNVSYLHNGLLINNRLTNSLDLNNVQSESIDSIEIIPSPRAFLYGTINNSAAVNFISRESFSLKGSRAPYSKIRYYQAPGDEAMIDVLYSANWFRRISTTIELTNKSGGATPQDRLAHSDFGLWNGTVKLKYLLSKNFNLTGSYNYLQSKTGLYGGTDPSTNSDYFANRYQKLTGHNLVLQLLGNAFEYGKTDLKAYYLYSLKEYRLNEDNSSSAEVPLIKDDNKSKTYGLSLRETVKYSPFNLFLNAAYEVNDFKADILYSNKKVNALSISGLMDLSLLDGKLIPSVFVKYLNYDSKSYPGLGADLIYDFTGNIQFYSGLSQFRQPLNIIEMEYTGQNNKFYSTLPQTVDYKKISSFEAGMKFVKDNLNLGVNFFKRTTQNEAFPLNPRGISDRIIPNFNPDIETFDYLNTSLNGVGLNLNFNLWKVYLESYSAYYYSTTSGTRKFDMPEYSARGGLYYRDTLFNANLHIKAGIYAQYTGMQSFYQYDFEKEIRTTDTYLLTSERYTQTVSPSLQVDFRLVAEIQQRVILYITYENITGRQIYVVPYFYKGRGLRIGVSWEFLD